MPQYHTHKEWFYFEHTPGACICQQFVFFTKRPNNLNPTLDRTQTHETQATDGLDSYVLMRIRCLTIIFRVRKITIQHTTGLSRHCTYFKDKALTSWTPSLLSFLLVARGYYPKSFPETEGYGWGLVQGAVSVG